MTHDEIQADLSLLALGTLDADERRAIEAHLREGCDACERELTAWREVVGLMPLELGGAAPAGLRPALLERVVHPAGAPAAGVGNVIRLPRRVLVPLAAAAAVVIALGITRETRLRSELAAQQDVAVRLRAELAGAETDLQRVRQLLAEREHDAASLRAALAAAEEALAIVQRPGLQMVRLRETPDAPRPATGHMVFNAAVGRAIFYAFDLPPAPEGKTYELWWITEKDGPINAGLFAPDPNGIGRVDAAVPAAAGAIQATAVTVEPAGGTEKPTGPMVLLGALGS